jgi:hypothetical protein
MFLRERVGFGIMSLCRGQRYEKWSQGAGKQVYNIFHDLIIFDTRAAPEAERRLKPRKIEQPITACASESQHPFEKKRCSFQNT